MTDETAVISHPLPKTVWASLFDPTILRQAIGDSFKKLAPQHQWRNPVMFVVYLGSLLATTLYIQALFGQGEAPPGFILAVTLWLWFTLLFANFAESVAEGRAKAQAASLRRARRAVMAKCLEAPRHGAPWSQVEGSLLRKGDLVLVEAGDLIPADGEVIEGVASVDESAITGESAPVIRESGGDFSAVTGGTRLLSDWLSAAPSWMPMAAGSGPSTDRQEERSFGFSSRDIRHHRMSGWKTTRKPRRMGSASPFT